MDNVVLSNWKTGINLEHDATVSYFNGGGKITNVKFDAVDKNASAKSSAGANVDVLANTYTENTSATGAGSGTATPSWAATWSSL